jgi:hypothetical protein
MAAHGLESRHSAQAQVRVHSTTASLQWQLGGTAMWLAALRQMELQRDSSVLHGAQKERALVDGTPARRRLPAWGERKGEWWL